LGVDPSERAAFAACIEGVADDASSPLRVLLTMRADFLDRLSEDRALLTRVSQGLFLLPPMTREGLRDALMKPLEAAGYAFEDDALCDEMLDGLTGTKSPLPLLQFTAEKLWEARDREERLLTRGAYSALGGVAGALSTHADSVLSSLSVPEQRLARSIVLRLVTPERTRAIVQVDELMALDASRPAVEEVMDHLASARLILIESSGEQQRKTVELTHESLIDGWGKLRQWLDEGEQDAQFLAQLRNAATQWDQNGQAEGFLWRDRAALTAGQWLEQRRTERGGEATSGLGKREERYLEAVIHLAERTRRRRRLLVGGIMAFLALFALSVSFLGLHARRQAARADTEAREAQRSAEEAQKSADEANKRTTEARNATRVASAREHQSDPTLVLALLREMEPAGELPPRWQELAVWARSQGVASVVLHQPDIVSLAAFSPDGKRIVTASWDRTARVWNADGTGEPLVLSGHQEVVSCAAWSPDGKRIVTASRDRTVRVWNADGTGEPLILEGHQDIVHSAAFGPDGQRIVTASLDTTVRVWSADGTGTPLVLKGHNDRVYSAAFSPDGKRIVSASLDKTARVWNADGTGEPLVLKGHRDFVYSAAWSPDGKHIVTASRDRTARVWNADGTGEPVILEGHTAALVAGTWGGQGAWTPDSTQVVTLSEDQTMRVWNADGTGEPAILRIPEIDGISVAWSPDGLRIATASHSGHDPLTGKVTYGATIWPRLQRIGGLADPLLWTATRYCPPIELRMELLGVSRDVAAEQLVRCQARVAEAFSPPR
ncbi:MAG: WD40 repeat domain-containing protein, partial [Polyangiaceae bacterium]